VGKDESSTSWQKGFEDEDLIRSADLHIIRNLEGCVAFWRILSYLAIYGWSFEDVKHEILLTQSTSNHPLPTDDWGVICGAGRAGAFVF